METTRQEGLFSRKEEDEQRNGLASLERQRRDGTMQYAEFNDARKALEETHLFATVDRAQARAEEYLNALLLIVAHHGNKALRFAEAFTLAREEALLPDLRAADTTENRRVLHALLTTISEMPDDWSHLDLRRFLLGVGEQGKAKYKYSGRAMFKNSDWTNSEVTVVCETLAGEENAYAQVLRKHEIHPIEEASPARAGTGPAEDYEIIPASRGFEREEKTRKPIDREFASVLRAMLEQRGL